MLPAVPTSKLYSPGRISPGENVNFEEPIDNPSVSALHSVFIQEMAVRCCGRNPGVDRLARIFVISTGFFVKTERATAYRKICPPPSPYDPSICNKKSPSSNCF